MTDGLIQDLDQLKLNLRNGVYTSEIQEEIATMLASFLRPETVRYDPVAARWLTLGWYVDQHLRSDDRGTGA